MAALNNVTQDAETLKLRLERNQKAVSRLLFKLRSYRLEPKNYECFQLQQQIQTELASLYEDQKSTLQLYTYGLGLNDDFAITADTLFTRYETAEKRIAEYLLKFK